MGENAYSKPDALKTRPYRRISILIIFGLFFINSSCEKTEKVSTHWYSNKYSKRIKVEMNQVGDTLTKWIYWDNGGYLKAPYRNNVGDGLMTEYNSEGQLVEETLLLQGERMLLAKHNLNKRGRDSITRFYRRVDSETMQFQGVKEYYGNGYLDRQKSYYYPIAS